MEIFVAIVPFAAVVLIAAWLGYRTYRGARPGPSERGVQG